MRILARVIAAVVAMFMVAALAVVGADGAMASAGISGHMGDTGDGIYNSPSLRNGTLIFKSDYLEPVTIYCSVQDPNDASTLWKQVDIRGTSGWAIDAIPDSSTASIPACGSTISSTSVTMTGYFRPGSVQVGKGTAAVVTITNQGGSDAKNVKLVFSVPSHLLYLNGNQRCTSSGGKLSCIVGSIAAKSSLTFTDVPFVAKSPGNDSTVAQLIGVGVSTKPLSIPVTVTSGSSTPAPGKSCPGHDINVKGFCVPNNAADALYTYIDLIRFFGLSTNQKYQFIIDHGREELVKILVRDGKSASFINELIQTIIDNEGRVS